MRVKRVVEKSTNSRVNDEGQVHGLVLKGYTPVYIGKEVTDGDEGGSNLVPRPSPTPVIDHFQYQKQESGNALELG